MAKSSKKSTNTKRSRSNSSGNGKNRMFKDGLSFASGLLESQKDWGSERISEFASATQEYATSMKKIPAFEESISYAGDLMENMADYISNNSLEKIVSDATGYVKRYPIAALAAGAAVGLIAIVASQPSWKGLRSKGNSKRRKASGGSIRVPVKVTKNRQPGTDAKLH
jgi:ElaB/YqjD/DUF883 family membrane-anchored ribosome-binding protein